MEAAHSAGVFHAICMEVCGRPWLIPQVRTSLASDQRGPTALGELTRDAVARGATLGAGALGGKTRASVAPKQSRTLDHPHDLDCFGLPVKAVDCCEVWTQCSGY